MNTLSSLKSLTPVTLEYVSPDRNPAVRAEFDAAGIPLPRRDIEAIIASDNLHARGVAFTTFGDDGAITGEVTLERPFSARGYPAVIRWRKNKRQGKYDRTDKGRVRKALYDRKDDRKARKTLRKVRTPAEEQVRRKMRREARSDQEFVTIDTEGVNIVDDRWTENAGQPDEATYTPQKIIVIAAGNEKRPETLCHVPLDDRRLGKDVPHLSSEDMMDFLCDLPGKFKKSFFVWYGGGYDATHLLKDLPYELGWEIAHQMPFSNAELPEEQRNLPNVGRVILWILRDGDGKPRKGFCINYLKGKWFQVGRLRDPARPWTKKKKAASTKIGWLRL